MRSLVDPYCKVKSTSQWKSSVASVAMPPLPPLVQYYFESVMKFTQRWSEKLTTTTTTTTTTTIIIIIIIMGRYYPNGSIAKNGQNPETNPGDLRRLAVTQTPV